MVVAINHSVCFPNRFMQRSVLSITHWPCRHSRDGGRGWWFSSGDSLSLSNPHDVLNFPCPTPSNDPRIKHLPEVSACHHICRFCIVLTLGPWKITKNLSSHVASICTQKLRTSLEEMFSKYSLWLIAPTQIYQTVFRLSLWHLVVISKPCLSNTSGH